jgi:hypothetical protein
VARIRVCVSAVCIQQNPVAVGRPGEHGL